MLNCIDKPQHSANTREEWAPERSWLMLFTEWGKQLILSDGYTKISWPSCPAEPVASEAEAATSGFCVNKGHRRGLAVDPNIFMCLNQGSHCFSPTMWHASLRLTKNQLFLHTIAFFPTLPTATKETKGVNLTHCLMDFLAFRRQNKGGYIIRLTCKPIEITMVHQGTFLKYSNHSEKNTLHKTTRVWLKPTKAGKHGKVWLKACPYFTPEENERV